MLKESRGGSETVVLASWVGGMQEMLLLSVSLCVADQFLHVFSA